MTGAKMAEQIWNVGNKPFLALALTEFKYNDGATNPIAPMGTWSGDRIAIIGDYSDGIPSFLSKEEGKELGETPNLYDFASENYTKVFRHQFFKDEVGPELSKQFPNGEETHHLVLNNDKRQYLDPTKFSDPTYANSFGFSPQGTMQGLYSLLFFSTGSGGGDIPYFTNGKWAGDRISIREKSEVNDLDSWVDISESVISDIKEHLEE